MMNTHTVLYYSGLTSVFYNLAVLAQMAGQGHTAVQVVVNLSLKTQPYVVFVPRSVRIGR